MRAKSGRLEVIKTRNIEAMLIEIFTSMNTYIKIEGRNASNTKAKISNQTRVTTFRLSSIADQNSICRSETSGTLKVQATYKYRPGITRQHTNPIPVRRLLIKPTSTNCAKAVLNPSNTSP